MLHFELIEVFPQLDQPRVWKYERVDGVSDLVASGQDEEATEALDQMA